MRLDGFTMRARPNNKITGANAGAPHDLPIRTCWAARSALPFGDPKLFESRAGSH